MTDKTKSTHDADIPQPETKAEETAQLVEITVTIPDRITVEHWQAYRTGKAKYTRDGGDPDLWIERYYGARELIQRGFVHIKGFDLITEAINRPDSEQKAVGMDIVSFVVINVALPVEGGINFPTTWRVS